MESRKMEMERNGIPAVIDKDDTDAIDCLLCSDNVLKDPNTFASLDDLEEFPVLGTLYQSNIFHKPMRTLKRPTSISPSQRASKKK